MTTPLGPPVRIPRTKGFCRPLDQKARARTGLLLLLGVGVLSSCESTRDTPQPESRTVAEYRENAFREFNGFSPFMEMREDFFGPAEWDLSELEAKTNRQLIEEIRESPYGWGEDEPARVLASRGSPAAALLLRELPTAEDYFLSCLATILGDLPSPERDQAFLKKLREDSRNEDDFLRDDWISLMILALAVNQCHEALPILRRYADDPSEDREIRAAGRVALNVLGEPYLVKDPPYFVNRDNAAFNGQDPRTQMGVEILNDLLRHQLLATDATIAESGEFTLESVTHAGEETTLKGFLPGNGSWTLGFRNRPQQERVPLYYTWYTGNVAAGGYLGLVKKSDERWLCTFWMQVWIS